MPTHHPPIGACFPVSTSPPSRVFLSVSGKNVKLLLTVHLIAKTIKCALIKLILYRREANHHLVSVEHHLARW